MTTVVRASRHTPSLAYQRVATPAPKDPNAAYVSAVAAAVGQQPGRRGTDRERIAGRRADARAGSRGARERGDSFRRFPGVGCASTATVRALFIAEMEAQRHAVDVIDTHLMMLESGRAQ